MTQPLAAVTGGTGFIGRACAVALARAGWQVRLLARRDPTHPTLADIPLELELGDLADEAALARLVRGADAVVHAAGIVRGRRAADFLPVNRDATDRLAGIVRREAPSCRFVLLSSQAARCPGLSAYAASKLAGEAAMRAALGKVAWTVLRPGIVYGPWDRTTEALLRLADLPVVPVPAAPQARFAMIHVMDVAAAVVACCCAGPASATYELCDAAPDGHAWRDVVRAATSRSSPRFLPVPDVVVLGAGVAADAVSAVSRRPFLFGQGKAREILHRDWRPDPAALLPSAIWQPAVPLAAGFAALRLSRAARALRHGPP